MRAKRRVRPEDAVSCYILEIKNWDWSYSFGLNDPRYDDRPFGDFRYMQIRAEVLLPTKVKAKAAMAELTFMPDVPPSRVEAKAEQRPLGVGYLDLHGGTLTGGFSMTADALGPVMQMLLAGRFRFLVLEGVTMRYGKFRIRHYRFEEKLDLDAAPGLADGQGCRRGVRAAPMEAKGRMIMSAKSIEIIPAKGTEVFILLQKLKKSPNSARKTPHSQAAIEGYATSIAAKGILQNLVVEPELDEQGTATRFYLVTIGHACKLWHGFRVGDPRRSYRRKRRHLPLRRGAERLRLLSQQASERVRQGRLHEFDLGGGRSFAEALTLPPGKASA
ncbi:hypothetical protein ABIB99_007035 [Bradyrhizobium sp. LA6.1]